MGNTDVVVQFSGRRQEVGGVGGGPPWLQPEGAARQVAVFEFDGRMGLLAQGSDLISRITQYIFDHKLRPLCNTHGPSKVIIALLTPSGVRVRYATPLID